MTTTKWDVDCSLASRVTDWTKQGGASAECRLGRCPAVNGVGLSGGTDWAIRYSVGSIPYPPGGGGGGGAPWHGTRVFGVGYSGVYARFTNLDGNAASVYGIFAYVNPGGDFNFVDAAARLYVAGDGALAVADDTTTDFARTAAGFILENVTYLFEFAAKSHGTLGTTEVRVDEVNVAALQLTGLTTRSHQVTTEDGFDYVGLGGDNADETIFDDFYFNETGFAGGFPCGTKFAGVTAYTQTLARGTLRTQIEIGGQPKGGYKRWRPQGQKPYPKLPGSLPIPPLPVEGGIAIRTLTELTTIAAAAFTDTTIQLPAGRTILSVDVRVIVTIPTATSFSVGDSGNATRFSTANVGVAAGSTDPGTKAGAFYNATATAVRLTMNGGTPATNVGRVRVTINYITSA